MPTSFAQPLFSMLEKMQGDMREMGFDSDIQASANVAARTVNAVMEQDQAKRLRLWRTLRRFIRL